MARDIICLKETYIQYNQLNTLGNGGKIVIVNNMETPLDSHAYLKYQKLEEVFSYISENI